LTYVINKYGIESLVVHRAPNGVPTSANYIGTEDNLSPHGNLLSKRLDEFNCVVYVNYYNQSILRKIQELGNLLKVDVNLSKMV